MTAQIPDQIATSSQTQSAPSSSTTTPISKDGTNTQLKASLRGLDYATQVQMLTPHENLAGKNKSSVHQAAVPGTSGASDKIPHAHEIQNNTGGYDISNVQAHTSGPAAEANRAMGADAYATGNHVVQQQHGVSLSGGVGQAGQLDETKASGTISNIQMRESQDVGASAAGAGQDLVGRGGPEAPAPIHGITDDAKARIREGSAPSPVWVRTGEAGDEAKAKKARHQAYDKTRRLGWNVDWFLALQAALGTRPTGHATPELADAVAEREEEAGRRVTGTITKESARWFEGLFPELATIEKQRNFEDGGGAGANVKSDRRSEDLAVSELGIASSYAEYTSSVLRQSTFCGHAVVGHPEFLSRLANAEAFLSARTDGLRGTALGERLSVQAVSSFRANTKTFDNLLHGIGFAIDVNPNTNNWNFGNGGQQQMLGGVMANVEALLGANVIKSSNDLAAAAKEATTEEAFLKIAESNEVLRRYRAFGQDLDGLEAWLASSEAPSSAKRLNAAEWLKKINSTESKLAARTGGTTPQGGPPRGFTDFDAAMVSALRDAGGLRWGGLDFGGDQNGDMMHFDQFSSGLGFSLRTKVRERRKDAQEPHS